MFDAIFSMYTLWIILMVLYVPVCFALIGIVLLQKGKGVGFAGAFGLGAGSEAMFGPRGSTTLPVRITQVLAGVFMFLALVLSLTGGMARRGLAPEAVEAATAVPGEGTGIQQLELDGLGSAVGGGASPEPGLTIVDESGEGEPEPVDLDADLPDIVLEDTPVELAPEAPEADEAAPVEETVEIEAEAEAADEEQPADGS